MASGRVSIARELTRLNMLVSTSSLMLACAAFFAYDLITFRNVILQNLSIQAELAGANSASALLFNDAHVAAQTLAVLKASPDILTADLLTPDGKRFSGYRRADATPAGPAPAIPTRQADVYVLTLESIGLARRVVVDGAEVGVVYIRSDLQPFYARFGSYALISGVVLSLSVFAALMISRRARRTVSTPIAHVAELANRIAMNDDFTVRAEVGPGASREVATVALAFNEMLIRIEERDRALVEARDQLEQRVRQRTAELDLAYKDLEAFSYSVSHDLRAPLRHVTGFSTLLANHLGASVDERSRRYIETIAGAASRMGRLIDDLLAFSRMGRASLAPRQVELAQVVRDAQAEIMPETAGREIVWDIESLPSVYADPALLRQVMINLLSNAVKYTGSREGARVAVGSSHDDPGEVVVFVRDNGVGFDMKYADKLFGVFQRLHGSDEFIGTGIGLANVRRIISRHGGRTWAHGEVNLGATFYFSLPEPAI